MQNSKDNSTLCGYCKLTGSRILYPVDDIFGNFFMLNQCDHCKAYFISPRPDEAMLSRAYDDTYYGSKEEKFKSPLVEKVLDSFRMGRARRLGRMLKPGSNVLDIGCGNGRFLKYLLNYGNFTLNGTELAGNSANRASRLSEIQLKTGTLGKGDFGKGSMDAVTMFHVFEHLAEPQQTLDIVDEILKSGGIFMASFPNIASLQSRMFKGRWLHLDPPRHLFFFAPDDFIRMMKTRGYELKKTTWISTEQNPYGFVQSFLNSILKKREVLFERLKGNTVYAPEYGKFSILMQKIVFLALFPIFILTDYASGLLKNSATVEFIFIKH